MSTFRIRAGQVLAHPDLRAQERLVLLAWLTHANPEGIAWPSIARLAKLTSRGERTVRRELKRLRERGLLEDLGRTPRGGLRLRFRSYPQRSGEPRSGGTSRPGRSGRAAPAWEAHEQDQENQLRRTNPLPYPPPSGGGDPDQVQFILEWTRDLGVDEAWWELARAGNPGVCHAVHRAMTTSKREGGYRGNARYRDVRPSLLHAWGLTEVGRP
jgi:hypothetical protein